MVEVDAGVDHGYARSARAARVSLRGRAHPAHTGRGHGLARGERPGRLDPAVGDHRRDLGIGLEALDLTGRELGGEALDGAAVDVLGLEPLAALAFRGLGHRAPGGRGVGDDVATGQLGLTRPRVALRGARAGVGPGLARTCEDGQA